MLEDIIGIIIVLCCIGARLGVGLNTFILTFNILVEYIKGQERSQKYRKHSKGPFSRSR